jgi:hypothetical protein
VLWRTGSSGRGGMDDEIDGGGFGMDGDRLTRSCTSHARPSLLALEAAFSPVAALAHDQPSTPTYSRPCTPRAPLIGSAQPACLRCVAALEQQPTIASSRRHPPHLHHNNPIYTQSPSLPRTIPTLLPSPSACRHNTQPIHHTFPQTIRIIHHAHCTTPTLQLQSSYIALRLARNPCTV